MASQVALTGGIYVGNADVSTYTDDVMVGPMTIDMKPFPNYGSGGNMVFKPGLFAMSVQVSGANDYAAAALDATINVGNARTQYPFSAVPGIGLTAIAAGDRAYLTRGFLQAVQAGPFQIGEIVGYQFNITGDTAGVRGVVGAPRAVRSSTLTGTAIALAGPSSSQNLYAALHVFATTGSPTLDVVVQSDDAVGFPSPTARITFAQATSTVNANWYQWGTPVGNFAAETHLRVVGTFGGTGSIDYAVTFGVL